MIARTRRTCSTSRWPPNGKNQGIGRDFLEHIIGVANRACQIVYLESPQPGARHSIAALGSADRDPSRGLPAVPGRGCAVLGLAL